MHAQPEAGKPGQVTPAANDEVADLFDLLDDVALSPLERLRLTKELAGIRIAMGQSPGTLERLKLAQRLAAVRKALGIMGGGVKPPQPPVANEPVEDPLEAVAEGKAERKSTSAFYDYDPNRKPAQRKRENAEAMAILARLNDGTLNADSLTDADKAALAKYSGTGGNLVGADGRKGSAYEYYTPKPIAEGMWQLMRELGFSGGRVLDPSSGVGIFGATAPVNAAMDSVELNATSGRVNQLVNDGPGSKTTIAPFEQVASATPDETYDAIITNVPFGEVADRGGNQFKDTKYRDEPIQNYFILRSLEKLRPGGLAAFITPPRCVSGKGGKEEDLRIRVSYMAEFVGAYRLPNSVFGTAAADTITDVIVFRKYSRAVLDKIEELREQRPEVLREANVLWSEFINGTYFVGEGRRFVLGEFVAKDPTKFRDVDRVINTGSMADIAKLLRKFPDSRVKWDLLDAAETTPIVYREGDTIRHAGQTLELRDGRWVAIESVGSQEAAQELADKLATLTTPLGAVNAGIEYRAAVELQQALIESARALDVPPWLRGLLAQLLRVAPEQRETTWHAAVTGLAVDQAFEERQAEVTGFNYLEGYAALSEAMKRYAADAAKPPTALSAEVKGAMRKVTINWSRRGGYSGVWRGDVATTTDDRSTAQRFEAERYQAGGGTFVPMDKARELYGADFDPMVTDDWCLSPDGQGVARADDYYVGNYAEFLAKINADIAAATDDRVREKLLRQKQAAAARLLRTDPSRLHFTLFSPFTTIEERAEFVRRFVDPRFSVQFDEKTGKPFIDFDISSPKNEAERNLRRFAEYLKTGTVSTRSSKDEKESNPELEKARMAALRNLVQQSEAQFNSWVKANTVIMGRLDDVANDPARLYFKQVEDDSPLEIPGLNPEWKTHGYQAAWVRKMGREFGGINGDGVGLGKTSQALIAVQHAQSIGVKKKTMIVVPNSVLSNWRKESARVYASTSDCLFVGLREGKDGTVKADPSSYDADLQRVLENRHRKIFVTYEAFQRLRLRGDTAEAYDKYLALVDASYAASDDAKTDEKKKSRRAELIEQLTTATGKSLAAPFFEDLGIDSLVIDEAHMLKNSRGTVEFKGGKFLSLAEPSARGLDAQAKAWFVRKDTPRKDGVILLTATPITNSPLEIYSMLSLAVGDAKLNDMMMGAKGSDHFMEIMCQMESRDEETLDGLIKGYDVFVGLNNVVMLRNALAATTTARTAEQVGAQIIAPEADENPTPVNLPDKVVDLLTEYKEGFRFAIDTLMEKSEVRGSKAAYERIAAKFGEPMELIGHPFNLIQKMSLLIADPELDERATFYDFSPAQADKVNDLVSRWNAKPPVEDRPRMGPHTDKVAVVGKKTRKDGENEIELLRIQVRAKVAGQRVVLDTMDAETQADFDALADKLGVDFDVTIPPKLAALLDNFQREEANPRGKIDGKPTQRVRQLIFCDTLAMHTKIKRLLNKHCGVSSSAIAIITGKVNGKPEDILAVQDGFNAEGEGNRYRVVIANEKAEVGINLQKGTQAIHHLTLGWTPDSLTQRNGRGVRQGNFTERVTVYHYDADGTFDTYKRMLVGKKSNWIDAVMDPEGDDNVAVAGGLTREQLESLIDSVGDKDAIARIQDRAETAERLARETSTRGKQAVNLSTIKAQREFVAKYDKPVKWAAERVGALAALLVQQSAIQFRVEDPKATASALVRNQNLLAEITARIDLLKASISRSVVVKRSDGYGQTKRTFPSTLDDFLKFAIQGKHWGAEGKMKPADRVATFMRRGVQGWEFEVAEDTPLGTEWRAELDMAGAMIEQSRGDFKKLAGQAGGVSADVLNKMDDGDAEVIDGRIVCVGTFVERSDQLGVVVKTSGRLMIHFLRYVEPEAAEMKRVAVVDELRKGRFILPGADGYDAAITAAAKIEDLIGATERLAASQVENLFSAVVPQVAQRRAKPLLVNYSASQWHLPSPHFPIVLPQEGEGLRVVPMIAKRQAAIVQSVNLGDYGAPTFTASVDAGVVEAKRDVGAVAPLLDYCQAFKVKLTADDYAMVKRCANIYSGGIEATVFRNRSVPIAPVLASATTADELDRAVKSWVEIDVFPWYDLSTDARYLKATTVAEILSWLDYSSAAAYNHRKRALEAAAAAGTAPPMPAPEATPEVDSVDPMRIVGISGDTKAWMGHIKASAYAVGGRPVWDGKAVQWNVPFKAWQRLVQDYPDAERALKVIEASEKLKYGRR